MGIKATIRTLPVLGSLLHRLFPDALRESFTNSAEYWERRYREGGNSGAGSYNRLARFKAEFLNRFVRENNLSSVIEFGCGDGAQLELAEYPSYVGVDVSAFILETVRKKFAGGQRYRFIHSSDVGPADKAELSLSLDVIYHLVEDATFDAYMRDLFEAGTKWVIVYASNEDKPWPNPHVRHRHFQGWVERNRPDFLLDRHVANPYPWDADDVENTSFASFYVFRKT